MENGKKHFRLFIAVHEVVRRPQHRAAGTSQFITNVCAFKKLSLVDSVFVQLNGRQ